FNTFPSPTTHAFTNAVPFSTLVADIAANGTANAAYGTVVFNSTAGLIVVDNGVVAASAFTTNVTDFAIRGRLASNTARFFCIDSTGKTNQSEAAPTSGNWATTCQ
ncbi:MAG: hypothetical protein WCT02_04330, partial [Candidatus Paceibacterota bacterium]